MAILWETTTVQQPYDKRVIPNPLDPSKKTTVSKKRPVKLVYPQMSLEAIVDPADIAVNLSAILAEGRVGYDSLSALCDYVNVGLRRGPTQQIQSGRDFRYSPAQREAITNFAGLVKNGWVKPEFALESLLRQGVPDAEIALNQALNPDAIEDEEEEEESETQNMARGK